MTLYSLITICWRSCKPAHGFEEGLGNGKSGTSAAQPRRWQQRDRCRSGCRGTGGDRARRGTRPAATEPVASAPVASDEQLRQYYRQMPLIRAFEERAAETTPRRRIGGYCHLNLGEEATVAGLMAALRAERLPVHHLPRARVRARRAASTPAGSWPSCSAGSTGCRKGGAGRCTCSTHAPPAGRVRDRRRPDPAGDRRGVRHRLPRRPRPGRDVVMCTAGRRHHQHRRVPRVAEPGRAVAPAGRLRDRQQPARHGHPGRGGGRRAGAVEARLRLPHGAGQRVDGNDVLAVRDAARVALDGARGEHQPALLEAVSYRLRGHSVVDPARYRTARRHRAAATATTRCPPSAPG